MIKLMCLMFVLFAFTACGGGDVVPVVSAEAPQEQSASGEATYTPLSDDASGDAQGEEPGAVADEPSPAVQLPGFFALDLGGNVINMDQNMESVIAMLGEPMGVFEAPSCAFDGIDRVFRFPGVQIHTYPSGDEDFVHTISLQDDTVATTGGVFLGQTLDDVIEAYGDDFVQEYGMVTFTRGLTTLSFLVESNMVIAITYGLILDI